MSENKLLPIGVDHFNVLVKKDYYYVDKTLLMKELSDRQGKVTLFTRPGQFGKTLNLSMLRCFFEMPEHKTDVERQRELFQGLSIMEAGEEVTSRMGRYPVIFLPLKSGDQPSWQLAHTALCGEIRREYSRHSDVLLSAKLPPEDKEQFLRMLQKEVTEEDYHASLQFLSECLEKTYERKAIILIDEYDAPLENAFLQGFYDEMESFLRPLFEAALKTNKSLEFAVITGCQQATKESIFTGFSDLNIVSVREGLYAEYFGFSQQEVDDMLAYYGCVDRRDEVKAWYGGYLFGDTEMYNPCGVINYVKRKYHVPGSCTESYGSNTIENTIVSTLFEKADEGIRNEIKELVAGGTIEKLIHEDITYKELVSNMEYLWHCLLYRGWLTKVSERKAGENGTLMRLRIPNIAVRYMYENHMRAWFE